MNPPIRTSIGKQVSLRRRQRGLSAAELARHSNLSKATLSAIESGAGNPTIETLDAIAVALKLPLTDLIATEADTQPSLQRLDDSKPNDISQELLRRFGAGYAVEFWHLSMPARAKFDGVPHAPGTMEYLLVNSGSLYAGPTDEPLKLTAGDFYSFPADGPHSYRTTNTRADVTVVMASPVTG